MRVLLQWYSVRKTLTMLPRTDGPYAGERVRLNRPMDFYSTSRPQHRLAWFGLVALLGPRAEQARYETMAHSNVSPVPVLVLSSSFTR